MELRTYIRWAGLSLVLGVVVYSAAMVAADPFEQETAGSLYQAIAEETALYRWINVVSAAGLVALLLGFALLARLSPGRNGRMILFALGLLAVATMLWVVEASVRSTVTVAIAADVAGGATVPAGFPSTIGIGFEALILGFLAMALAGLALFLWSLGGTGLLRPTYARVAALLVVVSGVVAAATYPWVGATERVFFYPLLIVVLPLGVILLVRSRRRIVLATG